MKSLIGAMSIAVLLASHASAQPISEKIEFICNTLDEDSSIILKIGDGRDGFPVESYTVDGVEKSELIVQYVFQVKDDGLSNQIVTVQRNEVGRIHHSASIQMTDGGMILESVKFNVDAKKPEDTAIQSLYLCKLAGE